MNEEVEKKPKPKPKVKKANDDRGLWQRLVEKSDEAISEQVDKTLPRTEYMKQVAEILEKKNKKKPSEKEVAERYKKNLEVNERFLSGGK